MQGLRSPTRPPKSESYTPASSSLEAPLLAAPESRPKAQSAIGVCALIVYSAILLALLILMYSAGHSNPAYAALRGDHPIPGQLINLGGSAVYIRDGLLNHPVLPETIRFSKVAILVLCGIALLTLFHTTREGAVRAVAVGLHAVMFTELLVSGAKNYIGYPRPNFYAGCGWSDEKMSCEGSDDAYLLFGQSFPSGHAAHSACIAALLALHMLRRAEGAAANSASPGSVCTSRLLTVAAHLPPSIAVAISASRVHDRWHHPADVVAGCCLGTGCAMLSLRVFFGGMQNWAA